jgi:hypothetical protein
MRKLFSLPPLVTKAAGRRPLHVAQRHQFDYPDVQAVSSTAARLPSLGLLRRKGAYLHTQTDVAFARRSVSTAQENARYDAPR